MASTTKLKFTSFTIRILLLFALIITSCSEAANGSDEEVNGSVSTYSAEFGLTELSSDGGTGVINYYAPVGTSWSVEITDGDDFASFSSRESVLIKSGVSTSAIKNTIYFYYDPNDSGDRYMSLCFAFDVEEQEPVEITLIQLSIDSENSPYNGNSVPRWNEIPAKIVDENYMYVTHSTSTAAGDAIRNFSLCFDIENHAAAWVAYPYHKVYDGDSGRNEKWTYDPKIPTSYQPDLSSSYTGSYDRGHQMASADRQATVAMNQQTFYYSNMTPQLGTLNQQKWATLETMVRDQICTDTLYVVTGADFSTSTGSTVDKNGMVCPLPGAYYKVMLRTRLGNTGKSVSECDAADLQAIGFWMEHMYYSAVPDPVSVKSIEEKTGFTFFPNVPDSVKETFKSTDWNF